MCGSNLETKQGLAGKNIDEILQADIGRDMNVVIETGGAQTWRSHGIDNSAIQRYEVKDGVQLYRNPVQTMDAITKYY